MPTPVDIAFFVVVVVGLAVRAWWGMRRLRAAPAGDLARLRRWIWGRAIVTQWGLVIALSAWWVVRHRPFAGLGLVPRFGWGFAGVVTGVAIVAIMVIAQRRRLALDGALRARVRARLANVERLMPATRAEWPGFASLAITAGICEEFLFRGFVTWVLAAWLPVAWAVLLAQAALFGLAHAYQGPRGVLATGAVGLFMGALVWLTGSLWAPMLLHALMDLHAGDLALRVAAPDGGRHAGGRCADGRVSGGAARGATAGVPPGPVPRELFQLALPILGSLALRLAFQWVDALWVRGLGTRATAAITTSIFVTWFVYALNDVFGTGLSAYVSQLVGAGDRRRAGVAVWKGVRASGLLGLVGTAGGLFGARAIFRVMDPGGQVVEEGTAYLRVVLCASPFMMMSESCLATMRATGDSRTPLLVDLAAIGFNAALAPLLIYGIGPFPRLGIAGAAWATVAAHAVMLGTFAVLAARRHPSLPLARTADGPPVRIAGMARVGVPAALIGALFSVVYVAFTRSASAQGAAAVAIVGIGNRLEAIQFVLSVAIGLAGASLLGRSLGAGRPERAVEVLRTGQHWSVALSFALMAVFLVAPRALLSWFSNDPAVWAIGVPYLRVLALTLPFTALEISTAEAVMGSGHTRALSLIYGLVSLARIPLAFLVPAWTHSGVMGIVWLITLSCMVRTIVILVWVARGTWKRGLARELHGREPGAPETPGGAC